MPLQSGFGVSRHSRINVGTAADSSVQVCTQPGELIAFQCWNVSSNQLIILKLYDSSGGTVSTTLTPIWRGVIPLSGALSSGSLSDIPGGAGFVQDFSRGLPFNTGLMYAVVATLADNTNTTVAASLAVVNLQTMSASNPV